MSLLRGHHTLFSRAILRSPLPYGRFASIYIGYMHVQCLYGVMSVMVFEGDVSEPVGGTDLKDDAGPGAVLPWSWSSSSSSTELSWSSSEALISSSMAAREPELRSGRDGNGKSVSSSNSSMTAVGRRDMLPRYVLVVSRKSSLVDRDAVFPRTTMTKFITFTLLSFCLCLVIARESPTTTHESQPTLVCTPFGECEPCPDDALHEPFCQPFGNRRLMHCSAPDPDPVHTWYPHPTSTSLPVPSKGETPAWQSCGRIPAQERRDFYEFVACNLFFATTSLIIALFRSRLMEARQARRLAARIGLVRGSGLDIR